METTIFFIGYRPVCFGRPRRTPKNAIAVQTAITTMMLINHACVLVPHGPKFPVNTCGSAEKDSQPQATVATSMTSIAIVVITAGTKANE
jgi:hypothetical protein